MKHADDSMMETSGRAVRYQPSIMRQRGVRINLLAALSHADPCTTATWLGQYWLGRCACDGWICLAASDGRCHAQRQGCCLLNHQQCRRRRKTMRKPRWRHPNTCTITANKDDVQDSGALAAGTDNSMPTPQPTKRAPAPAVASA
ncbi:hypothetical protein XavaCFBP5823_07695 [Xanthomonas axonopodis pv. vasculorum]|nr:hypothetical protein XavaCFBP5823_07695 [Xanthomonas axonopodis pv. vasculorum]